MDGDSAGGRGGGVGGRGQALAAMLAARRPDGPDDSTASSSTVSSKGRGQLLRDMVRLGDSRGLTIVSISHSTLTSVDAD